MKVIIEYDQLNGTMYDKAGAMIGTWHALDHFGTPDDQGATVRDLIKLKEAGFSAEEIVAMKEGGVL